MRQPPPEVRASWPAPNFTNPETRGPALVTVELLALSISSLFLGLRLYVRTRVVRSSLDWDDWLMVAGAVCQSTYRFRMGATGDATRLITVLAGFVLDLWRRRNGVRRSGFFPVRLGSSHLGLDCRQNGR